MTKTGAILLAAVLATTAGAPAKADVAGMFSQGRTHLAVVGGSGYAFDDKYFILGVGASYYLIDGFNVGLYVETWTGGDIGINKVTPSLMYVIHQVPNVQPYIGVFYRRTFIEDLHDLDSAGGRAGFFFPAGRSTSIGFGFVYESYLDCDKATYNSCADAYPEFSFTVAF
jgi:hypothetical protein